MVVSSPITYNMSLSVETVHRASGSPSRVRVIQINTITLTNIRNASHDRIVIQRRRIRRISILPSTVNIHKLQRRSSTTLSIPTSRNLHDKLAMLHTSLNRLKSNRRITTNTTRQTMHLNNSTLNKRLIRRQLINRLQQKFSLVSNQHRITILRRINRVVQLRVTRTSHLHAPKNVSLLRIIPHLLPSIHQPISRVRVRVVRTRTIRTLLRHFFTTIHTGIIIPRLNNSRRITSQRTKATSSLTSEHLITVCRHHISVPVSILRHNLRHICHHITIQHTRRTRASLQSSHTIIRHSHQLGHRSRYLL